MLVCSKMWKDVGIKIKYNIIQLKTKEAMFKLFSQNAPNKHN